MKTIIYLSEDSDQLTSLQLYAYFPEATLHPRKAVKLIPELIGKSFCTHSEAIVNQFGYLIANGTVKSEDVEIRLVSEEDGTVTICSYDDEGYLIDWPLGFFDTIFD
jgi:predicted ATPase